MTRPITVYEAAAGSRWDAEHDAIARDDLLLAIDDVMAPLGPRQDGCDFANGGGYIQHNPVIAESCRRGLLSLGRRALVRAFGKEDAFGANLAEVGFGAMCRLTDGSKSLGPIYVAAFRLMCIDGLGREWGQPFYAEHPEEAQDFEIKRESSPC